MDGVLRASSLHAQPEMGTLATGRHPQKTDARQVPSSEGHFENYRILSFQVLSISPSSREPFMTVIVIRTLAPTTVSGTHERFSLHL